MQNNIRAILKKIAELGRSLLFRPLFRTLPVRLSFYISCVLLAASTLGVGRLTYLWIKSASLALREGSVVAAEESASRVDRVLAQLEQSATLWATTFERDDRNRDEDSILRSMKKFIETSRGLCPELCSAKVAFSDGAFAKNVHKAAFSGVFIDSKTFETRSFGDDDQSFEYFESEWFLAPSALKRPLWTVPYPSEINDGELVVSFAVPFFRSLKNDETVGSTGDASEREVAGVVAVSAPVSAFYRYLPSGPTSEQNDEYAELVAKCGVFLTNQFGRFIVAPGDAVDREATIFTVCDEATSPNPRDRAAARSLYFGNKKSGLTTLKSAPLLKSSSEIAFARCLNGWVVGIAIPVDWVSILLRPSISRILAATTLALALVVGIIFIVCRRLNLPLTALAKSAEAIGSGDFSQPLPPKTTAKDDEVGRVAKSFEKMRNDLTQYIAELARSVAARERTEGELNAAKAIQRDLLPRILPPFEEFENVRGAAVLNPARGVGGDLYDVFPLDSDRLAFIVGDVSGKGVPAALFMAVTQTLQRSVATVEKSPAKLATRLNELLSANNESSMFVTYWIGVLNVRDGDLKYCCGGHNPPVLKRADGSCDWIDFRSGPPLGIVPDLEYEEGAMHLKPGDAVVLYTDGVTEAFNADGNMFGEERLIERLRRLGPATPKETLNELQNAVGEFVAGAPQSDDFTVLIVQRFPDKSKNDG